TAWPPVASKPMETMRSWAVSQPMSQAAFQTGADPGCPIEWWLEMALFFASHFQVTVKVYLPFLMFAVGLSCGKSRSPVQALRRGSSFVRWSELPRGALSSARDRRTAQGARARQAADFT